MSRLRERKNNNVTGRMNKNRNTTQWAFFSLFFCICIIGISVASNVGANISSPTVAPPGDNTPAYINIGDDDQVKAGALRLGTSDDTGSFNYQLEVLGAGALMSEASVVNDLKISESTNTLYVDSLNNKVCVGPCVDESGTKLEVSGGAMSVYNSTDIGIFSESTGSEAVYGEGLSSSYGVQGFASGLSNYGIRAASTLGIALEGEKRYSATSASSVAGFSDTGFGLYGINNNPYGLWAGYFDGIVESNSDVTGAKYVPTQLQSSLIPFTSGQVSDRYDISDAVVKRFDGAYLWLAYDNILTKVRAADGFVALEEEVVSSPAIITDVLYDGVSIWVTADIQDEVVKVNPQSGEHECPAVLSITSPKSIAFDGMSYWITAEDGSGNGILVNVDDECAEISTTQLVDSDYALGKIIFNGKYLVILVTHTASVEDDGYIMNVNPSSQESVLWEGLVGSEPADIFFDNYYYWVSDLGDGTMSRFYMSSDKYCSILQDGDREPCPDDNYCSTAGLGACFAWPEPYGTFNMSIDHASDEPSSIQFDGTHIWVLNRWIDGASVTHDELVGMSAYDPTITKRTPLTDAGGENITPTGMVFDGTDLWLSSGDGLKRAFSGTGHGADNLEQTLQFQNLDVSGLTQQPGNINISGSGYFGSGYTTGGNLEAENNLWGEDAYAIFNESVIVWGAGGSGGTGGSGTIPADVGTMYVLLAASDGSFYAGVTTLAGGRVYRSPSAGSDWVNTGGPFDGTAIYSLMEGSDGRIYAGSGSGSQTGYVSVTDDQGASWDRVMDQTNGGLGVGTVYGLVERSNGDLLAGSYNFGGNGYISRLPNGLNTWEDMGFPLGLGGVTSLLQTNNGDLFAGTQGATDSYIYKSEDGGQTWIEKIIDPDIGGVHDLLQDNSNSNILYAAVNTAQYRGDVVYKSTDYGENWDIAGRLGAANPNNERPGAATAIIQVSNGTLYAATSDAAAQENIWESTDQAVSWTSMGNIPGGTVVNDIIDAGDGEIFAALPNGDVIGSGFGPLAGSESHDCLDGFFITNIEVDENNEVTLIECRKL